MAATPHRHPVAGTANLADPVLRVADLVDRPGASRRVDLALPVPEELVVEGGSVLEPVTLSGVLESVVDGVLVRGRVASSAATECARCLLDLVLDVSTDVVELFSDPTQLAAGDEIELGYELRDGKIDLDVLLRDALVTGMPLQPLCRADCQGLCATCGIDRNEATCACAADESDARWAALAGLRLADPPEDDAGVEGAGATDPITDPDRRGT